MAAGHISYFPNLRLGKYFIASATLIFPPPKRSAGGNRKNPAIASFLAEGDDGEDEAVEAEDEHTEGDDIAEGHGGGNRVEDEIEA